MKKLLAVMVMVVSCAACLQAENRHAFYLEPDGAAVWAVTEEDVRSEAANPGRASRGETAVAEALRQIGAEWVETTVVREGPPSTWLTEARFQSASRMLERFLTAIGFEAESALWFEDGRTTLSFRFAETDAFVADIESEDELVECLVEPVEQYRFVLTEGRFVESTGFRLEAGETVAVMLDLEEVEEETVPKSAFYSLTWSKR